MRRWWGSKISFPPSKVCFSWVSREGSWDIAEFCWDVPDPWGCSKTILQKEFVRFSFPNHMSRPVLVMGILWFRPGKFYQYGLLPAVRSQRLNTVVVQNKSPTERFSGLCCQQVF